MYKFNDFYLNGIIRYIEDFYDEFQKSPTVREIAAGIGISKSSVGNYLIHLREQGRVFYKGSRGIITQKMSKTKRGSRLIPVVSTIESGTTVLDEENIEAYLPFSTAIVGDGTEEYFMFRVTGDTMINAGISKKDCVLARCVNSVEPGRIVVALVDDETILSRFYHAEGGKVRLHPENETMEDTIVDAENCIIQGEVMYVIKEI